MMYMRAHGSSPGPTQRPWLVGALCGGVAATLPIWILTVSGAAAMLAENLGVTQVWLLASVAVAAVLAGTLYSRVFGRAVNDRIGGWLFGIAFGFLLWVIGPIVFLQWFRQEPMAVNSAAIGVLVAHLVWGVILGVALPPIHRLLARRSIPRNEKLVSTYAKKPARHDAPA
jgi:hypothetical protein